MIDEILFRCPRFRPGTSIRLGDGQRWIFPAPPGDGAIGPEGDEEGAEFGPSYTSTVEAVLDAEDRAERRRAELALAIALLDRNYDLGPVEFQQLLTFAPGSPELAAAQEAFHELAREHIRSLRARRERGERQSASTAAVVTGRVDTRTR